MSIAEVTPTYQIAEEVVVITGDEDDRTEATKLRNLKINFERDDSIKYDYFGSGDEYLVTRGEEIDANVKIRDGHEEPKWIINHLLGVDPDLASNQAR